MQFKGNILPKWTVSGLNLHRNPHFLITYNGCFAASVIKVHGDRCKNKMRSGTYSWMSQGALPLSLTAITVRCITSYTGVSKADWYCTWTPNRHKATAEDILVFGAGDTGKEAVKYHVWNLREVFSSFLQKGIKLNAKKMQFKQKQVS